MKLFLKVWEAIPWPTGLPRANSIPSWADLGPMFGLLVPSWAHLGPVLGASWGHRAQDGSSWTHPGQFGVILEGSGPILALSWSILGPSWAQCGSSCAHLGPSCGILEASRKLKEGNLRQTLGVKALTQSSHVARRPHANNFKKQLKNKGCSMICRGRKVKKACQHCCLEVWLWS